MSDWRRSARSERAAVIAGVAAVHVAIGLLVLASSNADVRAIVEQPLQLITIPTPPRPPAPRPVRSRPRPAAAAPHRTAKPPPPVPLPVTLEDKIEPPAIDAGTIAGLGSSVGLGTETGAGAGPGAGGGAARHAEWTEALSDRDYPAIARAARLHGVVDVRFMVQADGRVEGCRVAKSSGNLQLDILTCALVEQRILYQPALDATGKPVAEASARRFNYTLRPRRR